MKVYLRFLSNSVDAQANQQTNRDKSITSLADVMRISGDFMNNTH